ncbi:mycothiol synthase [Staphylococcus chromogenes]|nr:mycothiol synthase [Staphylococcus chromogenes]
MNIDIIQLHLSDSPAHLEAVQQLLHEVAKTDGVEPFSEQFLLGLSDPRLGHHHFLACAEDAVVGVLALAKDQAELAVAPAYRRRAVATKLIEAAADGVESLGVWAHGNLPPARTLASKLGGKMTRELLVMATGERREAVAAPEGIAVFSLTEARDRWGEVADEQLLKVNNEAFSWHPEQGGWDMARWRRAQEAEWFSPDDVLLMGQQSGVGELNVLGFHWVKWPRLLNGEPAGRSGEVYVVGLADAARGKGLGAPLISAGIQRLWDLGAEQVELYVEADNNPAVSAYEALGFAVVESHAVYTLPGIK